MRTNQNVCIIELIMGGRETERERGGRGSARERREDFLL